MPLLAAEVLFNKSINKKAEVLFITQLSYTTQHMHVLKPRET